MQPDLSRLLGKVEEVDNCWLWTGAVRPNGYGVAWFRGKTWKAHRAFYTLMVGDIPDGLPLDHLCRNRACVNPAHLEPVTQGENNRRGKSNVTECPQGHPYTGDNLYVHPTTGHRYCRTCNRDKQRARSRASLHQHTSHR